MEKYKLIIEYAKVGDQEAIPFFEATFSATSQDEAEAVGREIADLTAKYKIVPPPPKDGGAYYHKISRID